MSLRHLFASLTLFACTVLTGQQNFTPQQRAWLYRVVAQTSVLNKACGQYFHTNTSNFTIVTQYAQKIDYNLGEKLLTDNPDSLRIDFEGMKAESPGILAELAVKTTLWELAHHLKKAIDGQQFGTDTVFAQLAQPIFKKLPTKTSHSKKAVAIMATVMHQSLPINVKQERLTQLKLTGAEQKSLLDAWTATLAKWIEKRSRYYFDALAGKTSLYELKMLAAGDGSGTAGLLYEYEPHPLDKNRNGYGVGIGLFTYSFALKNEVVTTLPQTVIATDLPVIDTLAVHCSLFGLDSSLKPMIVFTLSNKSYHLFTGSGALTANPLAEDGISYLDRIQQTVTKRINKPLEKLDKDGGLTDLFDKESNTKDSIDNQLHLLETEIDSLQKLSPLNQTAIDSRKRQINTLLSKSSAKARKLAELARKIDDVQKKVDNSRAIVSEMEALLGPNPQSYKQVNDRFVFDDGTLFDLNSQDLIFHQHKKNDKLQIRLIAASLTMGAQTMDEVQMFVNITEAPHLKEVEELHLATIDKAIDTTLTIYYWPDGFTVDDSSNSLKKMREALSSAKQATLQLDIVPLTRKSDLSIRYASLAREKQMPLTALGKQRKTEICLKSVADTLTIHILSSTDPVHTRLSSLPEPVRKKLSIHEKDNENNQLLATLRALWIARYLQQHGKYNVAIVKPTSIDTATWQKALTIIGE